MTDERDELRSPVPRRLEDQIALLRRDLRETRSVATAVPSWIPPAIVAALSIVALLAGVLIILVVFLMIQLDDMDDRQDLLDTWVRSHRHEDGPQPSPDQFKE